MSMWRPPERIRHDAQPGRWPSAAEAARSRLFPPIRVGRAGAAPADLGARDGALARDRRRLGHAERARLVRALRARAARAPWSSRPPAFATFRAARCCASATLASCRACAALVDAVRRASGGETRLFIQLIDFLSDPAAAGSAQVLRALPRHHRRASPRARHGRMRTEAPCVRGSPSSTTSELEQVLDAPRIGGAATGRSRARHRHRAAAHRRAAAGAAALFSRRRRAGARSRVRRRRAALCACLHHGLVSVGDQHAHRWLWRLARRARAAAARGAGCACAPRGRGLRGRLPHAHRGVHRRRLDVADADSSPAARRGGDRLHLAVARRQIRRCAGSRKVGAAAYPYTGHSGYECMPSYYSDAQGPFGRNLAAGIADPRPPARRRISDADRRRGRHSQLRAGRSGARGGHADIVGLPARRLPIRTGS